MGIARNIARLIPNGSGLLPNANIEAVAASKLTGTVSDSQIAGLTASKLSGVIPDANAPSGSVIQVVQTVSTTLQTFNGTAFAELSSLNTAITPSSASNKILVVVSICFSTGNDGFPAWRLYRGATWLSQSTASAPATQTTFGGSVGNGSAQSFNQMTINNFTYLDSPSTTNPTTYSIQVSPMRSGARDFALNRAVSIADSNQLTATSTMTLMEITP